MDTNRQPRPDAAFSLPHIAARFFNTPLLLAPEKAEAIAWALRDRLSLAVDEPSESAMQAAGPGLFANDKDPSTGYAVSNGVAVIPIRGTLVNRGAWIGSYSGLTSYEGIVKQLDMAASDNRVQAVMLDIHSYGGEATGCDDAAAAIRDFPKPIYGMIDGYGTSGAYWLACACDKLYIARSSRGGSIGVVLTHASYSKALEDSGVTVTHIHAGADKVLGSPYKDLSEGDRKKLEASVEKTYLGFVSSVAGYRNLPEDAVRQTEAGVFDGDDLVERGLADGVTTGRQLLAAIQNDFSNPEPSGLGIHSGESRAHTQEELDMSESTRKGGADPAAETYTKAEVDQLLATAEQDQQAAVSDARQQERERISAILGCEQAANRPAMAMHLATKTDHSAESAIELLAVAPEQAAAVSAGHPLDGVMSARTPGVSSDDGAAEPETEADADQVAAQAILNA